ncbi:MAG: TetR family transcriptional regulator [Deltaproteobacteria bacterium]|nr:TetR family transcriptional regulator [Deltaproteobacteria bacterium]
MSKSARKTRRESTEAKRRAILRAAVKVFAERGYHGCRIADVAREADVAYGLVYHYFEGKEALLTAVFEESWNLFSAGIEALVEQEIPFEEKIEQITRVALEAYRAHPHAVRVMVLEVARSPFFLERGRVETFASTFEAVKRLCLRAQEQGEVRREIEAEHLAYVLLGAVEMLVTGFVLGTLDVEAEGVVESATRSTVEIVCRGLLPVQGRPTP